MALIIKPYVTFMQFVELFGHYLSFPLRAGIKCVSESVLYLLYPGHAPHLRDAWLNDWANCLKRFWKWAMRLVLHFRNMPLIAVWRMQPGRWHPRQEMEQYSKWGKWDRLEKYLLGKARRTWGFSSCAVGEEEGWVSNSAMFVAWVGVSMP